MSLGYFPEPYPDELLYSMVARYERHMGFEVQSHATAKLFGTRHAAVSMNLPGRLSDFARAIGGACGLDPDGIIQNHTLFPYHASFQPASRSVAARRAMIGDGRSVHFLLGVSGSGARLTKRPLFCPICLDEMFVRHGEAYWRRVHQLPGVLVCPDHGYPLGESLEPTLASRYRHVAATRSICPPEAASVLADVSPVTMDHLARLARASAELLDPRVGNRWVGDVEDYRDKLAALGLTRSDRKVDVAALIDRFSAFYGGTLGVLGIEAPSECRADWLPELVRARRNASSPLRHLLLQGFLDGALRETDAGHLGPWVCLNPLAPHRGAMIVTDVVKRSHGGVTTGTFTCSCGYAYRRRLAGEKAVGAPTFKAYGPTLEPALRRLLVPGATQRGVAKAIGLGVSTMNARVAGLGLTPPWAMPRARRGGRVVPRSRECASSDRAPGEGDSGGRSRRGGSRPFDWAGTDAAVAERLSIIAAAVHAVRPAVRLTITEIERRLGRIGWIRQNASRLPEAVARVGRLVETLGAFRRRRIQCIVDDLDARAPRPAAWVIMRSAGVDSSHLPFIEQSLDRAWATRAPRS